MTSNSIQQISSREVGQWLKTAPTDEVIRFTHQALDTISSYQSGEQGRFKEGMSPKARSTFFPNA